MIIAGAGPGDPGLVSLKCVEIIKKADVILYDNLVPPEILNFSKKDAEKIPAGKHIGKNDERLREIISIMREKAREGKIVLRLKGGDPMIFGRTGEEIRALAESRIEFEIIPGVTAGTACAAGAGIPLTHREYSSSVVFLSGHEAWGKSRELLKIKEAGKSIDTLVIFMPVRKLEKTVEELLESGRDPSTKCALIQWGYSPRQRVLKGELKDIVNRARENNFASPAVFIVGEIVDFYPETSWLERKRLFGKGIVNLRAEEQGKIFKELLEEEGAYVFNFPVIDFVPYIEPERLDKCIDKLEDYDFVIFTSQNGVSFFIERIFKRGYDLRKFSKAKIIAIGSGTAKMLSQYHLRADYIPQQFIAEGVIDIFEKMDVHGKNILIPRAEEARELIPEELKRRGAHVDVIPLYRTVKKVKKEEEISELMKEVKSGGIHCVPFTSASTVKNFYEIVGEENFREISQKVIFACIGPITEEKLKELGGKPEIVCKTHLVSSLVEEIARYFSNSDKSPSFKNFLNK